MVILIFIHKQSQKSAAGDSGRNRFLRLFKKFYGGEWMKKIETIAAVLVILGAINWGLVGLFDFDVVEFLLGAILIDRLIYILIGIAGVFQIVSWVKTRRK